MLKVVNFKNVNFNEIFSHAGDIYQKVVRDTGKPGAVRISDGTVFNSCQNWYHCTVERNDEWTVEPPKERKKYILHDTYNDENIGASLTKDQVKLLFWLDNRSLLHEDVTFHEVEDLEFTEI